MIDLPVILFMRAIWEKKKNNKLNSISPANDWSAQMTFSWRSPSHVPATIKKKTIVENAAPSLSFVSNGRKDFDSQSKCLLSLEGSILLKADGVLMILWLFDILKTFISLIPLHITGASPGECLISPCAEHRGRFRLLQEHSHLGFEETTPPPPTYARPPLIFPVPLTETKILSSVTYGCIINEIRICIVLKTRDGVWCGGWGGRKLVHVCTQAQTSPRCARTCQSSTTKLVCDVAHDNQSDSTEERGARLLSCHLCCSGISWQLIWKVACFVRNV